MRIRPNCAVCQAPLILTDKMQLLGANDACIDRIDAMQPIQRHLAFITFIPRGLKCLVVSRDTTVWDLQTWKARELGVAPETIELVYAREGRRLLSRQGGDGAQGVGVLQGAQYPQQAGTLRYSWPGVRHCALPEPAAWGWVLP